MAEGIDINLHSIIFYIINFSLLVLGLNYLLYKPITRMLKDREKKVIAIVEKEKKLDEMIKNAESSRAKELKKIREETNLLLKQAQNDAMKMMEKASLDINKKTQEQMENVKIEMANEYQKNKQELANVLVDTSIEIAERVLSSSLSESQKKQITEEALKGFN